MRLDESSSASPAGLMANHGSVEEQTAHEHSARLSYAARDNRDGSVGSLEAG
jgi:hypothetical protein